MLNRQIRLLCRIHLHDKGAMETDMSQQARAFLHAPWEKVIEQVLAVIGKTESVERVWIHHYRGDSMWFTNREEWCSAMTASYIPEEATVPCSRFAWMHEDLRNGRPMMLPAVRKAPLGADDFRWECERQECLSVAAAPIRHEGRVLGAVGIDSIRRGRPWRSGEIERLLAWGRVFGLALVREESTRFLAKIASGSPTPGPLPEAEVAPGRSFTRIQSRNGPMLLPWYAIARIEADGDYTKVMLHSGETHYVRRSLQSWMARLPSGYFVGLRRGCLVQKNTIHSVERRPDGQWIARLRPDGTTLPISRRQFPVARDALA